VPRHESLLARWESGEDRALWDVLFADDVLRPELIVALAELSNDSIDIELHLRVRKGVR